MSNVLQSAASLNSRQSMCPATFEALSAPEVVSTLLQRNTRSVLEWAPCLDLSNQQAARVNLVAGLPIPSSPMTQEQHAESKRGCSAFSLKVSRGLRT